MCEWYIHTQTHISMLGNARTDMHACIMVHTRWHVLWCTHISMHYGAHIGMCYGTHTDTIDMLGIHMGMHYNAHNPDTY